ncbi:MAG: response regulator [Nitrososphaeraceae archaeon]|jgi:DNA-binding response OmpR family regulator
MQKGRILIIDDNEDVNMLFKIFLEYEGYKVDVYTDPIEALYYFKKGLYDLILLDLKMPKMDGILMFRGLKKIDEQVIICLTTANAQYIQELKKEIPNIDDTVITKPIILKDLKNKIDSLLENKNNNK